jgi:hypothetical protein
MNLNGPTTIGSVTDNSCHDRGDVDGRVLLRGAQVTRPRGSLEQAQGRRAVGYTDEGLTVGE